MIKTDRWMIVILFWGLLLGTSVYGQKKSLLWMHGLNGEVGGAKLQEYHNQIPQRYSVQKSYSPSSGVRTRKVGVQRVADDIYDKASRRFGKNDKLIYVGHSMGGLIGKELDIRGQRREAKGMKFHGIITLGSPLSGAKVANSFESRIFPSWRAGWGSPICTLVWEVVQQGILILPFGSVAASSLSLFVTSRLSIGMSIYSELFEDLFPMGDQTWQDLKKGSKGYAHRRNISTPTPKVHLWGNVSRPVFGTVAQRYGFQETYQKVVNLSQQLAYIYRWVPAVSSYAVTDAMEAHAYFKHTLNGRYANLISDGVSYTRRSGKIRTALGVKWNCFKELVRNTYNRCRSWGWFSWVCVPFVIMTEVVKCVKETIWGDAVYEYEFPYYADTDGVVSKYSATAQGQKWKSEIAIEVPKTEHNQLTEYRGEPLNTFYKIFDGAHPRIRDVKTVEVFRLKKPKAKPVPRPRPTYRPPVRTHDDREREKLRRRSSSRERERGSRSSGRSRSAEEEW